MPSTTRATRNRQSSDHVSRSSTRSAKRARQTQANQEGDDTQLPTPSNTQQALPHTNATQPTPSNSNNDTTDLPLSEINLQNYHQVKKFWPIGRIEQQLQQQKTSNHQISAAIIAEGQALMANLDHSLHMIAMISGVNLDKLKRSLGLMGGSHAENTWHRWLSFALEANRHPMPARGAPDASDLLTIRNQANSKAYRALKDEELDVFKAEVFYSLGGYPDYSSISIPEDNVHGDSSILVPEVPKLAPEEEEFYRPIYNRLVDMDKVARDRELNTPSNSSQKEEKRSLQCIKKIAQHLARDHQLVGLDYYLIACSNTTVGGGWCREYTSRDEISTWVSTKAKLQEVFPLYCQHRSTIEEVNTVAAKAKSNDPKPPNKSDQDKKKLGGILNKMVDDLIGYHPAHGFPRVPNPLWAITDRKIPIIVERDDDSEMTPEEFYLGFNGMNARARRHWLADLANGKFRIKKKPTSSGSEATGANISGSNDAGPATNSNQGQQTETNIEQDGLNDAGPAADSNQGQQTETQDGDGCAMI